MSNQEPVERGFLFRYRWPALAVVGVVVLVGGLLLVSPGLRRSQGSAAPPATVPPIQQAVEVLESGKVGDLTVTEEAIELAEIEIAPAKARQVAEKLPVTGTIEPGGNRLVKITPQVGGKVISVSVVAGDAVRAGQTLAQVESAELARAQAAYRQATAQVGVARSNLQRQQELARLGAFGRPRVEEARRAAVAAQSEVRVAESDVAAAKAAVSEAQSEVEALRAGVAQAAAQVKVARSRFERAGFLLKEELVSRQDWEQAQADLERAQADAEAARAKLAQGEAKVETARARSDAAAAKRAEAGKRAEIAAQTLAREQAVYEGGYATSREIVEAEAPLRQAELDRDAAAQSVRLLGGRPGGGSVIPLTTPIAGRVQERNVSLGETVDTEHALFTVINLDQVWVQLAVAPKDLRLVHSGQQVELTAESAPGRVFKGALAAVGNTADETTRTVRVRMALANPGGMLRPGAFVRGRIITDVRHERVTVPEGALQEHSGKPTVYVATGDKPGDFEVRHVTLGVRGDGWREVASELKAGERLAVNGTFYLKSEALKSELSDGCCAGE